jgi:hypothetical protein
MLDGFVKTIEVHGMQIKANQQSSVHGGPEAQYLDANRSTGGKSS